MFLTWCYGTRIFGLFFKINNFNLWIFLKNWHWYKIICASMIIFFKLWQISLHACNLPSDSVLVSKGNPELLPNSNWIWFIRVWVQFTLRLSLTLNPIPNRIRLTKGGLQKYFQFTSSFRDDKCVNKRETRWKWKGKIFFQGSHFFQCFSPLHILFVIPIIFEIF